MHTGQQSPNLPPPLPQSKQPAKNQIQCNQSQDKPAQSPADISVQLAKKLGADVERKLHPKSWIFTLLDNLSSLFFMGMIIAFNIGDLRELSDIFNELNIFSVMTFGIPVLIFVAITVYPLIHIRTFRFQITQGEIRVRYGLFNKQKRHLPLHKIHNVGIHQSFFHRLLDVAIVTLESAGSGQESEVVFKVLSHQEALLLEKALAGESEVTPIEQSDFFANTVIHAENHLADNAAMNHQYVNSNDISQEQAHQQIQVTAASASRLPQVARIKLTLDSNELVKYGLISNAGLALGGFLTVIASPDRIIFWLMQTFGVKMPENVQNLTQINNYFFGTKNAALQGVIWCFLTLSALLSIVIMGKIASVIGAFLNLHDFRLTDNDKYVSIEKGLFTRKKSRVPINKIQVWRIQESILHRWFGRQSLLLDTAILQADGGGNNLERGINELIPLATPEQIQLLLSEWGQPNVEAHQYYPVHAKAWRRLLFPWALLWLSVIISSKLFFSTFFIACLMMSIVLFIFSIIVCYKRAQNMGLVVTNNHLIWRDGWLTRVYCITELKHTHAIALLDSPFDRGYGMSTLVIDTVGGTIGGARFTIKYLDKKMAHKVANILQRTCR